jgi:hypothetical protein
MFIIVCFKAIGDDQTEPDEDDTELRCEEVEVSDTSSGDVDDTDGGASFLISSTSSELHTSVCFHDYAGQVDMATISHVHNQYAQTVGEDRPITTETAVQHSQEIKDSETQVSRSEFMVDTGIQSRRPFLTYDDVKGNDAKLNFYTGIPTSTIFEALFDELKADAISQTSRNGATSEQGRPRQIRLVDEFFLVLMRLRLGLLLEDLADRFCISTSLCSVIFNKWIDYLYIQLV